MKIFYRSLLLLLLFSNICFAESKSDVYKFKKIDSFSGFISSSKLGESATDNERLPISDSYVDVNVVLKEKPGAGTFSLVHFMMKGMGFTPIDISHSAFIAAGNGTVLNAYVTPDAAAVLSDVDVDTVINIKAIHLYNFSRGPRLIILAAAPVTES